MASRLFNGLTRAEVRTLLLAEIKSDVHERLSHRGTELLKLQFDLAVEFAGYPAEDATFAVRLSDKVQGAADLIPEQIVATIKNHLDRDTRFAGHLTFPKVSWDWHLDLNVVSPRAVGEAKPLPPTAIVSSDGKRIDLTPLAVTPIRDPEMPSEAALLDPHSTGIRRATTRMLATGVSEGASVADLRERDIATTREDLQRFEAERAQPSGLESRMDRIEALLERLIPKEPLPFPMREYSVPVRDGGPADDLTIRATSRAPVGKIKEVRNMTGTGLPITGGAKPSPGADAAASYGSGAPVGTAQTEEVVERIALARDHPGLDEGGIGAPDAARRAAGLPIPQRTEVKGAGVVELPLGTF